MVNIIVILEVTLIVVVIKIIIMIGGPEPS